MLFDIFIVVLVLWAAYKGWQNGFLKEVISTIGFAAGLLIAATCYSQFGAYLNMEGSSTNLFLNIVAFFLLWIIVPIFLGLVANLLTKALNALFLGIPNSLLGAAVSVLKYGVLLSCVLNVMSYLGIISEEREKESRFIAPVKGAMNYFFAERIAEEEKMRNGGDTVFIDMTRKQPVDSVK